MLKRILTAVLMLFVLLVVNSAGASNTVRIAYSDIDNFVGIGIFILTDARGNCD